METIGTVTYDDGRIACDDLGLVIRHYYPWGDPRSLPHYSLRGTAGAHGAKRYA